LSSLEKFQTEVLARLENTINNLNSRLSVEKIEELKRDVKTAVGSLTTLQSRLVTIQTHVEGTNQKAGDLQRLHDVRANQITELVERTSVWGFWTYFLIFQVFFVIVFVWWKRMQDEKSKKFL